MPLLTKKFTRDSLKRANGGVGTPNESEDEMKAEMIRREMARARAKSMRSRNALNQEQRRHRSLSRGPSSSYRSFGVGNAKAESAPRGPEPQNFSHPNDEYSQAFNEAELLTQMSSLTEPTWAPSVVGGSDINPAHHRNSNQNQRSRTGNYGSVRHQTRLQHSNGRVHKNRATITISTAKDHKETKVLFLGNREKDTTNAGHNKSNSNHGHHERADVGTEGIEMQIVERDERREDEAEENKRLSKNTESSDMRDDLSEDDAALSAPRTKHSSFSRRSRIHREDGKSNTSRMRGRSGRPNGNRKSTKRSSSLSSERSTQSASTAPTISKYSSSSSSLSSSVAHRKSKTDSPTAALRRRTTSGKEKSSAIMRSSSVPPSMSNSKRSQRTSSTPPTIFNRAERRRLRSNSQSSKTIEKPENNAMDATIKTSSTLTSISSQSNAHSKVSFATGSRTSGMSPSDSSMTPSSTVEAARMSLRPRLRRSNSNRSISSTQSESIVSIASNVKATSAEKTAVPTSPSKVAYQSRTRKLTQDIRAKKIHEQKQQRRHALEMEQQRRQQQEEEEKRRRKEARVAALAVEAESEEPNPTTVTTLVFDFLVFHLLLLFTLPQRAILLLFSRLFSKKWTARRKNVLVTGANSALGSETARQFAMEGANLILVSHSTTSSEKGLNWLVEECHQLGSGKIRSYSADMSNAVSTELTFRQAAKDFDDTFDVVILNGVNKCHGCLFEEIVDVHQIEKMVNENTTGCIIPLSHALKYIPKSSDSRIVVLSSISGVVASPHRSVYVATQHALKGFCDSIRMELNDTYTKRRAPKICFAAFPELAGQSLDPRVSRMGADIPPMKTHSWAAMPLQQAVHNLLGAITSGERDLGAPQYVNAWRLIQVLTPGFADFSIFHHFQKTQYRPVEGKRDPLVERKGAKGDGASVSNKTWT